MRNCRLENNYYDHSLSFRKCDFIIQTYGNTGPGFMERQVMRDLWWTKCHWGSLSPNTSVCPANSRSKNCRTVINRPVISTIQSRCKYLAPTAYLMQHVCVHQLLWT
jgi:hypothetical protein